MYDVIYADPPWNYPQQRPHATDPAHWETPWEDVPKAWRRGQLAAARAVLEAATPWLQATKYQEDEQ